MKNTVVTIIGDKGTVQVSLSQLDAMDLVAKLDIAGIAASWKVTS